MTIMPRHLVLWFALAALAFAPTITGAMPIFHGARYLPYAVVFFSIYSLSFAQSQLFKRIVLVILSIFLTLTVCDLAARPLLPYIIESRPIERQVHAWPPQPHLVRYDPSFSFDGVTYGDLAEMSRRKDLREERHLRFVTDRFGFRNEPSSEGRTFDLILLGLGGFEVALTLYGSQRLQLDALRISVGFFTTHDEIEAHTNCPGERWLPAGVILPPRRIADIPATDPTQGNSPYQGGYQGVGDYRSAR